MTVELEQNPTTTKSTPYEETSFLGAFDRPNVVVGIPCYNEETSIAKIVLQLRGVVGKIIVCDDGSSDMTADIARALGCEVVCNPRNLGKGAALRTLFLAARAHNPDVFVTLDGDGQHNALDVSRLVSPIIRKECDIAIGSRFEDDESQTEMPLYRKFGSQVINSLVRKASKISARDTQSGFRAYSREAVMRITPGEYGMAVDTEILTQAAQEGLGIKELPTKIKYEGLKTSKQDPLSQSLDVIASTIKFVSLRHPLLFYGALASIFFVISSAFALMSLFFYGSNGALPFGPALLAVATFLISLVLGAAGVILYSLTTVVRQKL